MEVASYLTRIAYTSSVLPDARTLQALHRAHLLTIPYENLDLHCEPRRGLSLDVTQIYDKIVGQKRGGWCYEMNGLFAWVLREVGFDVTILGSAVGRLGNPSALEDAHILLKVIALDQPNKAWIADVGFGNAFLEPLLLQSGIYRQDGFTYRLERDDSGRWWFTNHLLGGAGFDFSLKPFELNEFAAPSNWLQTAPESGFVRVPVCQRHLPGGKIATLRALTLTTVAGEQRQVEVIQSLQAYAQILTEVFGLDLADSELLWQRTKLVHEAWLLQNASVD